MKKTTHRWDAKDYARNSSAQQQWALELMDKLALQGDEVLLDLGCGDGKISAELSCRLSAGRVVGLDSSGDMVALAQREYGPDKYANLAFVQGDARQLEYAGEFDVIFSNAVLHWIRDHGPVLKGIGKALKPGGQILLQMGGKGNVRDIVAAFDALIGREKWAAYFADFTFPYGFYGPEEYGPWLAAAGLEPERIELIAKDMVHSGPEGLAGWARTTWLPYLERVPEGERETLVGEVVAHYLEQFPPDERGQTHVQMVRLEVAATKGIIK